MIRIPRMSIWMTFLASLISLVASNRSARSEELIPIWQPFVIDAIQAPPATARSIRSTWNGEGLFAATWVDNYDGTFPFNALAVAFDTDVNNFSETPLLQPDGAGTAISPDIASTPQGFLMTYGEEDMTYRVYDVYSTVMNVSGTVTGGAGPLNKTYANVSVSSTRLAGFQEQKYLVVWTDRRFLATPPVEDIFARTLDILGKAVDTKDFVINDAIEGTLALTPVAAANETGDFLVVWSDNSVSIEVEGEFIPRYDIYSRIVPRNHVPDERTPPNTPVLRLTPLDTALIDAVTPSVAFGGGRFLVAWKEGTDIWARTLQANGAYTQHEGFLVSLYGEGFTGTHPSVVYAGAHRFIIIWRDSEGGGRLRGAIYDAENHAWLMEDALLLQDEVLPIDAVPGVICTDEGRILVSFKGPDTSPHVYGHLFDLYKPGDLTNDGKVTGMDLLVFSTFWDPEGVGEYRYRADLNWDGVVDQKDLHRFVDIHRILYPAGKTIGRMELNRTRNPFLIIKGKPFLRKPISRENMPLSESRIP